MPLVTERSSGAMKPTSAAHGRSHRNPQRKMGMCIGEITCAIAGFNSARNGISQLSASISAARIMF